MPALNELIAKRSIRLLALQFVRKQPDGTIAKIEYDALGDAHAFAGLDPEAERLLDQRDVDSAAEMLGPGTAGALLVREDLWAASLAEAVRGSGGRSFAGPDSPRGGLGRARRRALRAGALGPERVRARHHRSGSGLDLDLDLERGMKPDQRSVTPRSPTRRPTRLRSRRGR